MWVDNSRHQHVTTWFSLHDSMPCHTSSKLASFSSLLLLLLLQTSIKECLDQQEWPALGRLNNSKAAQQQEEDQVRLLLHQQNTNRQ